MDCRLGGPLGYYALVLMLLGVQWRPGFSFPATTSCDDELKTTTSLTKILGHEAKMLLDEYKKFHDIHASPVPDDVPKSTISGNTNSEKLQDIYIKGALFQKHMSKVEDYQREHSLQQESLDSLLSTVKHRLGHLSTKMKILFTTIVPEIPLPETPAPPKPSHDNDYAKKVYGLGVIRRLEEWITKVLQLLKAEEVCKVHH